MYLKNYKALKKEVREDAKKWKAYTVLKDKKNERH